MGFQDRDYYRDPSAQPAVRSWAIRLVIINVVLFLADALFGGPDHQITNLLKLSGDAIVHPWQWYQFLTAGFVHQPEGLWHITGNMLGLYFFGLPLEDRFGTKEFLRFYLAAILVGTLTWGLTTYFVAGPLAAANAALLGASGGVTATIILFCILYPRVTLLLFFVIPVPAWLVGILIVAGDLFGTQQPGGRVAYDVHLAGAAFAAAYWYFGWNFGRFPGAGRLERLFGKPQKWFKPRPPLKMHDPEQYYEDLDAEADRVLAKLGAEGEASLTPQERRTLEAYSRRMRQKRR
jgi:membrane associated rhomboid family serine protease